MRTQQQDTLTTLTPTSRTLSPTEIQPETTPGDKMVFRLLFKITILFDRKNETTEKSSTHSRNRDESDSIEPALFSAAGDESLIPGSEKEHLLLLLWGWGEEGVAPGLPPPSGTKSC